MCAEESRRTLTNLSSVKVSVIICCHSIERIEDICKAVQSAMDQTYPLCEVIVAVDHNQELLEKLEAKLPHSVKVVLNTGKKGISGTRNAGVESATGDIITFIDDDQIAKEDWLEQLLKHYREESVLAVGGRIIPLWESSRPWWFPQELDWIVGGTYKGMPETGGQIRHLWTGNMSFRREILQQVGLFRTDLGRAGSAGQGEDTEFCLRIRARIPEAVILYEPNAVMYHNVPWQRGRLKYVVRRSFDVGFSLAQIRKSQSFQLQVPLSTERTYLHYLLTAALLERIKRSYKPQSFAQIGAIMISIAATGMGYLVGSVRS